MKPNSERLWKHGFLAMCMGFALGLTGCLSGGDGEDFGDLVNGSINDVDILTITEFLPDSGSVTIEQSQTQIFYIAAKAPVARTITYTWKLNGAIVAADTTNYSITGAVGNVGDHTVVCTVSDGVVSLDQNWTVKVNGPPVITPVTTGTPKVSVGSTINIVASATDPNGDGLTYTWKLNGVASANLTNVDETATLTGVEADVGSVNITVEVSDGSASDSYTWTAEVNNFPMACNTLSQYQICTFAGSPLIGDGIDPTSSPYDERIRPIGHAQDALGNYFLADWENNVIWYWNKTSSDVVRVGVTVPANTLKQVAGSGEAGNGADGIALQNAINRPRAVAYNDATGNLYISDYYSHKIRVVDTSGLSTTGMGGGTSQVNGDVAYNHRCQYPQGLYIYSDSLYVACRNEHRVKRWDLTTDLVYTVYGDGGGNIDGEGGAPTSAGARFPYGVFVNADGIYVSHMENHVVRFINTSGAPKGFWGGATTVSPNTVRTIIGTGSAANDDNLIPTSNRVHTPTGIVVASDKIFLTSRGGDDRLMMANNTGGAVTYDGVTVNDARIRELTYRRGYNGTNVDLNSAEVNEPYHLSINNQDGNSLIASEYYNAMLREYNLGTEKVSDVLGSGKVRYGFYGDIPKPSLEHLFNQPTGIAYDATNRKILFVDQNNYRVREVDAYGNIQTVLGRGAGDPEIENDVPSNALLRTNYSGNLYMNGADLLSDGSFIQLNGAGHSFRVWNRSGTSKTFFGTYVQDDRVSNVAGNNLGATQGAGNGPDGPALDSEMNFPTDVAVYNNGGTDEIFVADQLNHCIRHLTSDGNLTAVLGTCGSSGNSGPDVAAGSVLLNRPHGLVVDQSNGNLIFTDTWNHKVRYWNRTGGDVTFAGYTITAGNVKVIACSNGSSGSASEGILSISARCNQPTGIDLNSSQLCFANTWRHNVRCIDLSDGKIYTRAGNLESTPAAGSPGGFEYEGVLGTSAPLYYPTDVKFDENDDLLISDRSNHIIRKLKLSP